MEVKKFMKEFLTDSLRWILRKLAQSTIARYRPGIVGVTGSVGKTSAKLAIAAVLGAVRRVRVAAGNLNNELGLPLTILGSWSPRELALVSRDTPAGMAQARKALFWIKVVSVSVWRIILRDPNYPEVLVLEYGADRPGDIKSLLKIARPNVSVITAVGETPVHVEFYAGPEEVAREKGRLIESLPVAGFAIMNYDDETVMRLAPRTRGRVISYGFAHGADLQISRFEHRIEDGRPAGISFRLTYSGGSVPIVVDGAFGRSQAYAAAAAAAAGLIFGLNLVKIADALAGYQPAPSRMQIVPGVKETTLIDDSYNASPLSMHAALDALRDLPAKRRIAVLGDMLEIGKYAPEAHERVGRLAARAADIIVTIGPRAKFIAEGARAERMKAANIYSFDTADAAARPIQDIMKPGDLILLKGSHAMQLDRVVKEIRNQQRPV